MRNTDTLVPKKKKYSEKLRDSIELEMRRIRFLPKESYDYKYGLSFIFNTLNSLNKLKG